MWVTTLERNNREEPAQISVLFCCEGFMECSAINFWQHSFCKLVRRAGAGGPGRNTMLTAIYVYGITV